MITITPSAPPSALGQLSDQDLLSHIHLAVHADRPRTARPVTTRPVNAASRRIPAAIKRLVWQRDGGQCAFTGSQGRCTATGFLEYHHVVPFAAGGETSAGNIVLRCKSHNQYEADR